MNRKSTPNPRQYRGYSKKTEHKSTRLARANPSDSTIINNILSSPVYVNRRKQAKAEHEALNPKPTSVIGSPYGRKIEKPLFIRRSRATLIRKQFKTSVSDGNLKPTNIASTINNPNLKPLPPGELLSSPHTTKKQTQLMYNRQFSHKYLPNHGSLVRELTQDYYRRNRFPNQVFTLLASGADLPKDVTVFKVPMTMSKPMIKNYLEEIYKVRVKKVNTAIMIGGKRVSKWGIYKKLPDYKKAYVRTSQPFFFPWPRPPTFKLTDKEKKKRKEKAEREAKLAEEDEGKNAV